MAKAKVIVLKSVRYSYDGKTLVNFEPGDEREINGKDFDGLSKEGFVKSAAAPDSKKK